MNVLTTIKKFVNSSNKIYFLEKNKYQLFPKLLFFGILLAFIGFFFIEDRHILESITNTLQMLIFNLPTEYSSYNILFPIAIAIIGTVVFYTVLFTFFKQVINDRIVKNIRKNEHTIVFGLSEINKTYLSNSLNNEEIIIYTQDEENFLVDEYKNRGFGIVYDINKINPSTLSNLKYAVISFGDDKINMDFAMQLIDKIKLSNSNSAKLLIVHIENTEFKELFHQKFLNFEDLNKYQIDIKTFSYFEECSNNLFDNHSFISNKNIDNSNELKSIILGNGNLALNIIKNLLLLSNFPHKNQHTIYLIDKDAIAFKELVKLKNFYSEEKFPTVKIAPIDIGYESIDFFNNELFKDDLLQNIFICYDQEEINFNLALELENKIFIRNSSNSNVFLALFEKYNFIKESKFLDKFTIFGTKSEVLKKDFLINEENYTIAKMIHYGYGEKFVRENIISNDDKLNKKWFDIKKYSDRLSSVAQSKHINIKLQALGLYKTKSTENINTLLEKNIKIFDDKFVSILNVFDLDYDTLYLASLELEKAWSNIPYEVKIFPKNCDTLFEKLLECEHERWNAFHYINGWEYNEKKDKNKKNHNCLKPLNKFLEKGLQITVIYDLYSFVYIPNYLASAGYEICSIENQNC